MGLPMENDLLKLGIQKNLLLLTVRSINIVLIDHVICHMTIFLRILKLTKPVVGLRKEVKQYYFLHSY